MKAICKRESLLAAFQTAGSVAPTRSPKPILQNVKMVAQGDMATLIATDLEVGIRVDVAEIEIEAGGEVILPMGRFGSILRETTDEKIRIEATDTQIIVRGDRSEFKLSSEPPAEFPPVAEFDAKSYHEISARLLREMIRRTVFSTDNESSRYALGGVLLEMSEKEIIAVATDGRRLATMKGPAISVEGHSTGDNATIVPSKAMHLIERSLSDSDAEVQLSVQPNGILLKSPHTTIYSRLVEGRFPKWRDVFPDRTGVKKVETVVGPFFSAVRQAAVVTSGESSGVDFTFESGQLVLTAQTPEAGESRVELPIAYDGEALSITLNPHFLSDFLKVLDPGKTITLELKNAESAAVCTTDDGYDYLLMPLSRDR